MTINVAQLPALILGWVKLAISYALIAFIALVALKLFGVSIIPVAQLGWQELGVFLAGTAYALRNL